MGSSIRYFHIYYYDPKFSNLKMTNKKILYISPLCSKKVLDCIFSNSSVKPGLAVQKFHRLIVEGLSMHEKECCVETLSAISITSSSNRRYFWNIASEIDGNIRYNYIPMINLPVLKSIIIFINSFFKLAFLILSYRQKEKIILCDILYLPLAMTVFLASKIFSVKCVAIVTDLPGLMIGDSVIRTSRVNTICNNITYYILSRFDGYVLLTKEMNNKVNSRHKPFLIMEGLVDISMETSDNSLINKKEEIILLYAGGLYEKYGIKNLIEAFMQLKGENLRLHLYGPGEMERDMPYYTNLDKRIVHLGVVPNDVIIKKELEATLLVNPRPSNEEFTKYSFPSKNMEYMVSGTPIVTTPLSGMPIEYYDYIYLFSDETVSGLVKTLKYLVSLDGEELHKKGEQAKEFVLKTKNNMVQANRILNLCSSILID